MNEHDKYDVYMNTASALFLLCYLPEIISTVRNKNANIYNLPEKVIMSIASGFALSYAVLTKDKALIINYTPILTLDIFTLLLRGYYAYKNRKLDTRIQYQQTIEMVENPIHNLSDANPF